MNKYIIIAIIISVIVGMGASYLISSEQLSADVLRSDTVINGNLSVNRSALVMDDLYVTRNRWASTSTRTNAEADGFVNCPNGEFVTGINVNTGEVKCSKL